MSTTHETGFTVQPSPSGMPTRDTPLAPAPRSGPQTIDAVTLLAWMREGRVRLLDVREADEHAAERIDSAVLMPLSTFDPASVRVEPGMPIVAHCKSGKRSAEACARLCAAGRGEVYTLQGGIEAWKAASLPTITSSQRLPIPIMRQVQITVGVLLVPSAVLAIAVSPWFAIVPAMLGAGLFFAGVSGTCGLASLLSIMPWNRALRSASRAAGR